MEKINNQQPQQPTPEEILENTLRSMIQWKLKYAEEVTFGCRMQAIALENEKKAKELHKEVDELHKEIDELHKRINELESKEEEPEKKIKAVKA